MNKEGKLGRHFSNLEKILIVLIILFSIALVILVGNYVISNKLFSFDFFKSPSLTGKVIWEGAGTSENPYLVTDCGELNQSGYYVLQNNVSMTEAGTCFNISVNNLIFYGANHNIFGLNLDNQSGIFIENLSNISINNLIFTGFTNFSLLINNVSSLSLDGIYIPNSKFVNLINSSIINSKLFNLTDSFISNSNLTNVTLEWVGVQKGRVLFLENISAYDFYSDIDFILTNFSVFLNTTKHPGMNVSANITFDLTGWRVLNATILRDGQVCNETTNSSCYNFTSLNGGLVEFNVSSFGNYFFNGTFSKIPLNFEGIFRFPEEWSTSSGVFRYSGLDPRTIGSTEPLGYEYCLNCSTRIEESRFIELVFNNSEIYDYLDTYYLLTYNCVNKTIISCSKTKEGRHIFSEYNLSEFFSFKTGSGSHIAVSAMAMGKNGLRTDFTNQFVISTGSSFIPTNCYTFPVNFSEASSACHLSSYCSNSVCDSDESCSSCPSDCGMCASINSVGSPVTRTSTGGGSGRSGDGPSMALTNLTQNSSLNTTLTNRSLDNDGNGINTILEGQSNEAQILKQNLSKGLIIGLSIGIILILGIIIWFLIIRFLKIKKERKLESMVYRPRKIIREKVEYKEEKIKGPSIFEKFSAWNAKRKEKAQERKELELKAKRIRQVNEQRAILEASKEQQKQNSPKPNSSDVLLKNRIEALLSQGFVYLNKSMNKEARITYDSIHKLYNQIEGADEKLFVRIMDFYSKLK